MLAYHWDFWFNLNRSLTAPGTLVRQQPGIPSTDHDKTLDRIKLFNNDQHQQITVCVVLKSLMNVVDEFQENQNFSSEADYKGALKFQTNFRGGAFLPNQEVRISQLRKDLEISMNRQRQIANLCLILEFLCINNLNIAVIQKFHPDINKFIGLLITIVWNNQIILSNIEM